MILILIPTLKYVKVTKSCKVPIRRHLPKISFSQKFSCQSPKMHVFKLVSDSGCAARRDYGSFLPSQVYRWYVALSCFVVLFVNKIRDSRVILIVRNYYVNSGRDTHYRVCLCLCMYMRMCVCVCGYMYTCMNACTRVIRCLILFFYSPWNISSSIYMILFLENIPPFPSIFCLH